jgi:hypothetical protein
LLRILLAGADDLFLSEVQWRPATRVKAKACAHNEWTLLVREAVWGESITGPARLTKSSQEI